MIKELLLQPLGSQKSQEYQSIIEKTAVGVHLNNRSILIAKNVFGGFFNNRKTFRLTRSFNIRRGTLAHNILSGIVFLRKSHINLDHYGDRIFQKIVYTAKDWRRKQEISNLAV